MRALVVGVLFPFVLGCPATTQKTQNTASSMRGKNMEIVQKLTRLCDVVSQNTLSGEELRGAALEMDPKARVTLVPGSTEPAHLSLTLPEAVPLTAFQGAFGQPHEAPMLHPESPQETLFYPDPPSGRQYACVVIAQAQKDASVLQVTLRRDPK